MTLLSVISVFSVLPVIVFIQKRLAHARSVRRKGLCVVVHEGHFLHDDGVVHRLFRVLSPGEGAVVAHEASRNRNRVYAFESLRYDKARVLLVFALDLLVGQRPDAGNGAVEVIGMGGSSGSMEMPACAKLVAQRLWVWTMPPIAGKAL